MNKGRVSSGYQFSRAMLALNGISEAPSPHSSRAKPVATQPIAANTRCPVSSRTIIDENISRAMSS